MTRWLTLLGLILLAGSAAGLLAGCGNACVELSKKVCRCKPTEAQQHACVRRVENDADVDPPSDAQQEQCEDLIDGCNCKKLASGNLAACGLATEDP